MRGSGGSVERCSEGSKPARRTPLRSYGSAENRHRPEKIALPSVTRRYRHRPECRVRTRLCRRRLAPPGWSAIRTTARDDRLRLYRNDHCGSGAQCKRQQGKDKGGDFHVVLPPKADTWISSFSDFLGARPRATGARRGRMATDRMPTSAQSFDITKMKISTARSHERSSSN
jgi:hypothetical protein